MSAVSERELRRRACARMDAMKLALGVGDGVFDEPEDVIQFAGKIAKFAECGETPGVDGGNDDAGESDDAAGRLRQAYEKALDRAITAAMYLAFARAFRWHVNSAAQDAAVRHAQRAIGVRQAAIDVGIDTTDWPDPTEGFGVWHSQESR